jgi:hypothetical protein
MVMKKKIKSITPALQRSIDEVNKLIEEAASKDVYAGSYFGSTIETDLDLKPIRVNNQFVTIEDKGKSIFFGYGKERFNVNNSDDLSALKSDLGYIKRGLTKAIREA